ncbi:hypothetical protein C8J57DRAFT_734058 [Mycena rebaudengoi]|nr:hypothetical protein C8J57DRAFT_734058 [Mycena rebaudengoi]
MPSPHDLVLGLCYPCAILFFGESTAASLLAGLMMSTASSLLRQLECSKRGKQFELINEGGLLYWAETVFRSTADCSGTVLHSLYSGNCTPDRCLSSQPPSYDTISDSISESRLGVLYMFTLLGKSAATSLHNITTLATHGIFFSFLESSRLMYVVRAPAVSIWTARRQSSSSSLHLPLQDTDLHIRTARGPNYRKNGVLNNRHGSWLVSLTSC